MRHYFLSFLKIILPHAVITQKLNKKGAGAILLTFDDGPHPDITPKVLDLLDEYKARSLFFVTGTAIKNSPSLVKEILSRGHKIGNHTFSHMSTDKVPCRIYRSDIEKCQRSIHELTGDLPVYFRPPKGLLTIKTILSIKFLRIKIVRWSLDTGEYSYLKHKSSQELAENFLRKVKSRDIVLSHDDNDKIPEMLRIILPVLTSKGFDLYSGLDFLD